MESTLHQVWESASGNPFSPTIGKGSHFLVGFSLLTIGLLLSGLFGLSKLLNFMPTYDAYADIAGRPVSCQHWSDWSPSFVSYCVSAFPAEQKAQC